MSSPKSIPSLPIKHIRIRVLREIPVFAECRPEVGKVYDAIQGFANHGNGGLRPYAFCVVPCGGKQIVLRRCRKIGSAYTPDEYEEVYEE